MFKKMKKTKGISYNIESIHSLKSNDKMSPLQKVKKEWEPILPEILRSHVIITNIKKEAKNNSTQYAKNYEQELSKIFPLTIDLNEIKFEISENYHLKKYSILRIGVVLSGGQAAGGHNVIAGLMNFIKMRNQSSQLYGFLNGPEGIYKKMYVELTEKSVSNVKNQGGFDLIGSGRHKIETEEQLKQSLEICNQLELHGIVIIGGDDSNTNAAFLAEYFAKNNAKTCIVGCPKTIDADLKNETIEVSFGYDSAIKVFSEELGNIACNISTIGSSYVFVRLMGRSASHITLECALQIHPNLSFIGEDIRNRNSSLMSIVDEIVDCIIKREELGFKYGLILLPEGLVEFIPEFCDLISQINIILETDNKSDILNKLNKNASLLFSQLPDTVQNQLLMERDPHGNVQVAKIAMEVLLLEVTKRKLLDIGKGYLLENAKTYYLGYEGRSCIPSNFDASYCYSLGTTAGILIDNNYNGYMAVIKNLSQNVNKWIPNGYPLVKMMNIELRKGKKVPVIKKYLVDLNGKLFRLYKEIKEQWKYNDYYRSIGPLQFEGNGSNHTNYILLPPSLEDLLTYNISYSNIANSIENNFEKHFKPHFTCNNNKFKVPKFITNNNSVFIEHKPSEINCLLKQKLPNQLNKTGGSILQITKNLGDSLDHWNINHTRENSTKITHKVRSEVLGVILCDTMVPGIQNIIIGLIEHNIDLYKLVFFKSIKDFLRGKALVSKIEDEIIEQYKNFTLNSQCYTIINGNNIDLEKNQSIYNIVKTFSLTKLVLLGGTEAIMLGSILSENFYDHLPILVIPICIENSLSHRLLDITIGFDSVSRFCSAFVGNLLTDSVSAKKYWYFIKLLGPKTSNIPIEVALQTHSNIICIEEKFKSPNISNNNLIDNLDTNMISLTDIINYICDCIITRSHLDNNFGGFIMSEGLFDRVYPVKQYRELYISNKLGKNKTSILQPRERIVINQFLDIFQNIDKSYIKILIEAEKMSDVPTENIIAELVSKKLSNLKKLNKFKGTFNVVCFNIDHKLSSCFPSSYDCQLSYIYGRISSHLLSKKICGGYTISITNSFDNDPNNWNIYAIPITDYLDVKFSLNDEDLINDETFIVPNNSSIISNGKAEIVCFPKKTNLTKSALNLFYSSTNDWELNNYYMNPGPMQYSDPYKNFLNKTFCEKEINNCVIIHRLEEVIVSIKSHCKSDLSPNILKSTLSHLEAVNKSIKLFIDQELIIVPNQINTNSKYPKLSENSETIENFNNLALN